MSFFETRLLRTVLSIMLWLCAVSFAMAQRQGDVWYFGNRAGLSFSGVDPFVLMDGATSFNDISAGYPPHSEASSVICNSEGNLLFYSDAERIWDRNHQLMPNGSGLLGHRSSTQGVLIVPKPGSQRLFYVFTTDNAVVGDSTLKNGLRYSVVDMCVRDGLGDVVQGQKNILLLDTVSEKLTAVLHSNGNDYWVLAHRLFSDEFHAFLLTQDGLSVHVVSKAGSWHPHPAGAASQAAAVGQMKVSPDGRRLALVTAGGGYNIAELCDFNAADGTVNDCVELNQSWENQQCYGVSFSPDNGKLYTTCISGGNDRVHQFDLMAGNGDPESIRASRRTISQHGAFGLQLANNGRIYMSRSQNVQYLAAINDPNNLGLACNFQDSAIWLEGRVASMGLPNFIDSYAYTNGLVSCTEEVVPDTLVIPTAFTPDGDGVNDSFTMDHLPAGSGLVIYSRWGREVYRSESYAGGWDGGNVTGGVYYYILTLPDGGRRKGVVHVVK